MAAPIGSLPGNQSTDINGLRFCGIFPKGKEPSIRTLREWTRLRRIPYHLGHFIYYDPIEIAPTSEPIFACPRAAKLPGRDLHGMAPNPEMLLRFNTSASSEGEIRNSEDGLSPLNGLRLGMPAQTASPFHWHAGDCRERVRLRTGSWWLRINL